MGRASVMSRFGYLGVVLTALLLVLLLVACSGGDGDGDDGSDEVILPTTLEQTILLQPDGTFLYGPGEEYVVRTELETAHGERAVDRESLVVFHDLAGFGAVDEESPARSEWLESCEAPVTDKAFRPQESLSLQASAAIISAANDIDRSPVTGREVDFAIHTGSEADNAQFNEQRWFIDLMDGRLINPDSGGIGYTGVQKDPVSPDYPSLLDDAQAPFQSEGLDYPWYAVMGNRDILVGGSFPPNDAAESLVTGGEKLMTLGPDALERVCAEPSELLVPGLSDAVFDDPETVVAEVDADEGRRFLSRPKWVREHFISSEGPGPAGHGFSETNRTQGSAYYQFTRGIVRFLVLDTVNEGGFATGSMGAKQFEWLEKKLVESSSSYLDEEGNRVDTENPDRLVVIVSHHAPAAMTNPFPGVDEEERYRGPQLEELLHRFPNVILHVAGHASENRISARPDPEERTRAYWEVTTTSAWSYPMQARLLEIVDNKDGTISIFSTVYDSAAPVKPGDAKDPTPEDGVNELLLASVARQVAVTDPQLDLNAIGLAASDHNAEMLIMAPFDLSAVDTEAADTE
jgi:metallophosphoesterase (TIGR03767 family)